LWNLNKISGRKTQQNMDKSHALSHVKETSSGYLTKACFKREVFPEKVKGGDLINNGRQFQNRGLSLQCER
jgi:hypothetical protein